MTCFCYFIRPCDEGKILVVSYCWHYQYLTLLNSSAFVEVNQLHYRKVKLCQFKNFESFQGCLCFEACKLACKAYIKSKLQTHTSIFALFSMNQLSSQSKILQQNYISNHDTTSQSVLYRGQQIHIALYSCSMQPHMTYTSTLYWFACV